MKFLKMFRNWDDMEEVPPQTVIFSEGDPADVMYVIVSGEVGLTLRGETVGSEGEGGIFGEMAMINSAKRSDTATALSEVRLARMDRERFRQLVNENPEFSFHVMSVLANRLRAIDDYISTKFLDG
jgi:CRP-like cAMP-binding protein